MRHNNYPKQNKFFPIDIVYLWVDGSDKNFQQVKNKYLSKDKFTSKYVDDTKDQIFRDNQELKYALRSIEQNTPWINHIYIITPFNQKPLWLNTKNKKITIVPQESILPSNASPTFNSCAIEMCLANIPGLSEHFLLANDDMFFNKPVKPDYFFYSDGRAKFRCIYRKNGRTPRDKKSIYLLQLINAANAIEKAFGKSLHNYKDSHGIDPYIKSSIQECCKNKILSKVIKSTINHKFREATDVHRSIFNLYDIIKNRADIIISHSKHVGHNVILDSIYNLINYKSIKSSAFYCHDAIESNVLKCKAPIVCINDSVYNNDITREHNKLFFETKFPNKSKFEKQQ
nr:Stealth CR1 domain-containing protein [Candidatus Enterousia merdequi]